MSRLSAHECIQRGTCIEEDHVSDLLLAALKEDEVARIDGRRDVGYAQVIIVHVVNANTYSEHAERLGAFALNYG